MGTQRLQHELEIKMRETVRSNDMELKEIYRVIVGELQRQTKSELADDEVIGILRKLSNNQRETMEYSGEKKSRYLDILESYLPQMACVEEIENWIRENINFSEFKNKMQAMKPIMAYFGNRADGKIVKQVLDSLE